MQTRPTHRRSAPYSTQIPYLSETSSSSVKTVSSLEYPYAGD
jgi:hypothetical protein